MSDAAKLVVKRQYVKSVNLVSPNSPKIFSIGVLPGVKVYCDISVAKSAEEGDYEVDLMLGSDALLDTKGDDSKFSDWNKDDDGNLVAFQMRLRYAGLCSFANSADQGATNKALLVDAPVCLFPFAREIIAHVTAGAGYPPLMLDMIDFGAKYQEQLDKNGGKISGISGGDGDDYESVDPSKIKV